MLVLVTANPKPRNNPHFTACIAPVTLPTSRTMARAVQIAINIRKEKIMIPATPFFMSGSLVLTRWPRIHGLENNGPYHIGREAKYAIDASSTCSHGRFDNVSWNIKSVLVEYKIAAFNGIKKLRVVGVDKVCAARNDQ